MKVLVACEYSGIVSNAFKKRGHDVLSCDLLPSESYDNHYMGNVLDLISPGKFDLLIGFPPCTYLAKAQMHLYEFGKSRIRQRNEAVHFFSKLWRSPVPRICLENPIGYINTHVMPPSQILSPHYFGSPYSKEMCFWLKNLPPLLYTLISPGKKKVANHCNSRMTQTQKSKIKSKFFPELAEEMANQWG
jgi:hypothetical protein